MSKHNLSIKKINKQILSINSLIESNFDKLKYFKPKLKKFLLNGENRVILGVGIAVILTLSYFLIPTFYDKGIIQSQIKNQILKNYNIDIKFNEKIKYGLLPKPHFSAKNLLILREKKEIGVTKNLKVFIGIGQFFSLNKIDIKNLVFNKTDFKIYLGDFLFFQNLLNTEPHENEIIFKNANIFFKNENDEVLFINKISVSKFFYDPNNLQNVLTSKNKIFNIPFKLAVKNDKFNKKIYSNFNSKKIRLKIKNETSYENETKRGLLDTMFINKNTSMKYEIGKKSLSFFSKDNQNSYKGKIDFKPFYFLTEFNYEGLSSKNIFNDESILIDLINSEILNNKNLSANLNFRIKDITNINELNNLNLKISIEEGEIRFSDSFIMWKDDLKILLNDGLISLNDDGINLIGTMVLNFENINNFYSSFQVKKISRKDVKQIEINFLYNLNTKNIRLDNPKINSLQSIELEEFLNDFNSKENRVFNKITFKNFISSFFGAYAG